MKNKALIVQSDFTVLLDPRHERAEEAREALSSFAELMKSPDGLHTYRITPLTLWNAASAGQGADSILAALQDHAKFGVPKGVADDIKTYVNRYGLVRIERNGRQLVLRCEDEEVLKRISQYDALRSYWEPSPGDERHTLAVRLAGRGAVKRELMRLGFPVVDLAGYQDGEPVPVALRPTRRSTGEPFELRAYQREAVEAFFRGGDAGSSGVLVLPCGAGKTVIGIAALAKLGQAALILTTNATSVAQWREELIDKTTLEPGDIGEYVAERKEVRPVTIATYQILTHRSSKDADFLHMKLFRERPWGLIIYDEVHLLPAPVFRATAEIQATRRLGLTATLVREDGREEDVFSLVGPKRYETPWKRLEREGWIASVDCTELRVPLTADTLEAYRRSGAREKLRIAGENPMKIEAVKELLNRHPDAPTLVIGQYLEQLRRIADELSAPLITGETPARDRETLYGSFRRGELRVLVVSKVANFALDLPDAAVAVQVSGSFGSRQEEAQRIGRVLRPKSGENCAYFYTVVSEGTKEMEFAMKRQLFLIEQGYRYNTLSWPLDEAGFAEANSRSGGKEGERAG